MSVEDQIAKLEALLARVRSRAQMHGALAEPPAPVLSATPEPMLPAATNGHGHEPPPSAVVTAAPKPSDRPGSRPHAPLRFSPMDVPTPMAAFRPSPVPPAAADAAPAPPAQSRPPSAPRIPSRPEAPPLFMAPEPERVAAAPSRLAAPAPASMPRPQPSRIRPVDPPPMEVVELEIDPDPSIPPPSSLTPLSDATAAAIGHALESRSRLVSAPPASLDDEDDDDLQDRHGFADSPQTHASDPTIEVASTDMSRLELEAIEESERAPSSSRRPISLEEKMSEPDDVPLHAPPPASGKLPAASPALDVGFDPPALAPQTTTPREAIRAAHSQVEVASFVGQATGPGRPSFGDLLDAALSL